MSDTLNKKEPLLFICHRIPFPPNKGDKIRSFNILKKLSEQFDVHLGCFIDDPYDRQYVDGLNKYCREIFYLNQNKTIAKIKGLQAFVTQKPITLPYYFEKKMQQWVDRTIAKHAINKVFIYSSSMAQYCTGIQYGHLQRVIDFVDVDSDKWRQYADKKTGLSSWVFHREHGLLADYEDKICTEFDYSLFVSADEAELFRSRQAAHVQGKIAGLLNGVDTDFFNPEAEFSQENLVPETPFISFTGAMDYWANIDAVLWFVEHVWSLVLKEHPAAKFLIVGGNPSPEIVKLANTTGIIVTGRVHDVRPFIARAKCVVAPLRIARGIQNKVLEAMSLNMPVVSTTMAMEGINAKPMKDVHITDDVAPFAEACLEYLAVSDQTDVVNRQWIIEHFTWQQTLVTLNDFFLSAQYKNRCTE